MKHQGPGVYVYYICLSALSRFGSSKGQIKDRRSGLRLVTLFNLQCNTLTKIYFSTYFVLNSVYTYSNENSI